MYQCDRGFSPVIRPFECEKVILTCNKPLSLIVLWAIEGNKNVSQTEYRPVQTVLYIRGQSPESRRLKLKTVIEAAVGTWGESWLLEPDIEVHIQRLINNMTDVGPPGEGTYDQRDIHQKLSRVRFVFDGRGSLTARDSAVEYCVETDSVTALVIPSLDHIVNREIGVDLLQDVLDAGVHVHCVESGIIFNQGDSVDGKTRAVVRSLVESVSGRVDDPDSYQHTGGRPPFGFEAKDGQLVRSNDFGKIATVLQQVKDNRLSRNKAADRLGCARATVNNCLDRPEMYGLD